MSRNWWPMPPTCRGDVHVARIQHVHVARIQPIRDIMYFRHHARPARIRPRSSPSPQHPETHPRLHIARPVFRDVLHTGSPSMVRGDHGWQDDHERERKDCACTLAWHYGTLWTCRGSHVHHHARPLPWCHRIDRSAPQSSCSAIGPSASVGACTRVVGCYHRILPCWYRSGNEPAATVTCPKLLATRLSRHHHRERPHA